MMKHRFEAAEMRIEWSLTRGVHTRLCLPRYLRRLGALYEIRITNDRRMSPVTSTIITSIVNAHLLTPRFIPGPGFDA